jgi:1,4-alpha-glucan branching enzyme
MASIEPAPVDGDALERIDAGTHHDPHDVLGPHLHDGTVTIRALRPLAKTVAVLYGDGERVELAHESHGVWVAVLDLEKVPDYRLEVTYGDGPPQEADDPYRYLP